MSVVSSDRPQGRQATTRQWDPQPEIVQWSLPVRRNGWEHRSLERLGRGTSASVGHLTLFLQVRRAIKALMFSPKCLVLFSINKMAKLIQKAES